tara:strand:+ start:24626 stop:26686 length:2061 start_codon:yes stop_codon:yes gene_type:complete
VKQNGYLWFGAFLVLAACGEGAIVTGSYPDGSVPDGGAEFDAAVADAGVDAAHDAAPNTPPTISSIADQSTQFAPLGPILFDVDDAETAAAQLIVTASSSDQAVLPDANIALGGTDAQRSITLTPQAGGSATITITVNDGTTNGFSNFLIEVTNINPTAAADSYATVGNTVIEVVAIDGVLANDSDDDGDTVTAIADTIVSSMGGSVTLSVDGSFLYLPPVGVRDEIDTFDYLLTDGFETSTGTASVAISDLVWYVDSTAPATGDGRSTLPVQTLTEAETASGENDIVFVAGESYDAGISLKNGQFLIGAPTGLTVDGVELIAPSAIRPSITDAAAAGVRLAASTEVRGLAIENTAGDGISGSAVTRAIIDDVTLVNTGGQGIDLGNTNPAVPVVIQITGSSIVGISDFSNTPFGIDIQVGGNGGGSAQVLIDNNAISLVPVGVFLAVGGTTGTGVDGANTLTVTNNTISDFDDDGVQIEPDDTAVTEVVFSNNAIDGLDLLATATPVRGVDFRVRTTIGGATSLTMQNNVISDTGLACANLISFGAGNAGTFTALVDSNSFTGCGLEGLLISPDKDVEIFATVQSNTMVGNGAPSTFEFATGTAHQLNLNLLNNDDDQGFQLERSAVGIFNLAGLLGQGSSFNDDNGNIADNGNTSAGAAPLIIIVNEASSLQINIVDAATVLTP